MVVLLRALLLCFVFLQKGLHDRSNRCRVLPGGDMAYTWNSHGFRIRDLAC